MLVDIQRRACAAVPHQSLGVLYRNSEWVPDAARSTGVIPSLSALIVEEQKPQINPVVNSGNGFTDSAFIRNRELPVHRWVPLIAGFAAQFVDDCRSRYFPPMAETIVG